MATDLAGNSTLCSFEVLVNTPPVGEDDTVDFLEEDDEIEIDVLDNDWDPDGDDIFLCGEAWAEVGQVEIENGLLIYAPFEGWCGTDTITYVLCDEFNASDTAQVEVQVECFIDLIIPEGISPNGDGVNDVFEIIGLEDYPGNTLTIYNRWGYKIFEAENYKNDWDGKACQGVRLGNGLLPTGTYFFVLQLGDATIKPVKGFIYLNH
jgi:gliding motility-associated-like protein